ncbi:hypothetical protein CLIB1444_03S08724 [[Candida] jaroonii]|uniref:Uncharacterized protein n=1 Tax=[Candida] jaroonii TaxID=467808 RepID=A0ACA9Y5Z4_9ASCO|nr:hypothetical protein CLIB1444_03S08724 [[Candida] jaroonii]
MEGSSNQISSSNHISSSELDASIKKVILGADGLIIKESIFKPIKVGSREILSLSMVMDEHLQDLMKEMDWKCFHRVYFSIPFEREAPFFKNKGSEETFYPTGLTEEADIYLYDVEPKWTGRIERSWFDDKFKKLDKKLDEVLTKVVADYRSLDKKTESEDPSAYQLIRKFGRLKENFIALSYPFESNAWLVSSDLFQFMERWLAMLDINYKFGPRSFELDDIYLGSKIRCMFEYGKDTDLFFFVHKKNGLKHWVDEETRFIKNTPQMNSIIKEASKYMIGTKIDCCLITDLETSILLQLDFETSKGGNFRGKAVVPFKYYVCFSDDVTYTLHAILCSVIYYQKCRREAEDSSCLDNVKKLRTLLINQITLNPSSKITRSVVIEKDDTRPSIDNVDEKDWKSSFNPSTINNFHYQPLNLHLNDQEYELLQIGGPRSTTVLKLNRSAIDKNLSHLNLSKTVNHVIVKVYDLSRAEEYYWMNDLEYHIELEELRPFYDECFCAETESYERIMAYNKCIDYNSRVNIPKMYEYGEIKIFKEGCLVCFGWHLILEYLEKDEDQMFDFEEAKRQVDILGNLGILHNKISSGNIIVSKKNFHLIDFSNAKLDEFEYDFAKDQDKLKKVWEKINKS